jgi:hypothetical protein
LIKTWAMRGTLHLVRAADLPLLVAALSTRTRYERPSWLRAYELTLEEMRSILDAIPEALDGRCLTREELAEAVGRVAPQASERLRSGWGELLKPAAFLGLLCFGPAQGQRVTFVRPDQWVPGWHASPLAPEDALAEIARRFLHVFGPATPEDFAKWWGTDAAHGRRVFRGLGEELAEVEIDGRRARALIADVAAIEGLGHETASAGDAAAVRLLPNFDAYVMGYQPRSRLVPEAHSAAVFRAAGWVSPVVLIRGVVAGVWEQSGRGDRVEVTVTPFRPLERGEIAGIEREAEAIGEFLGAQGSLIVGPRR